MDSGRNFTHLQLAVAGLLGSPIATAALASWNIRRRGKGFAGAFFAGCISVVAVSDVLVGKLGSHAVGVLTFLGLVLLIMLANFLLTKEDRPFSNQGWLSVLVIIAGSFVLAVAFRIITR